MRPLTSPTQNLILSHLTSHFPQHPPFMRAWIDGNNDVAEIEHLFSNTSNVFRILERDRNSLLIIQIAVEIHHSNEDVNFRIRQALVVVNLFLHQTPLDNGNLRRHLLHHLFLPVSYRKSRRRRTATPHRAWHSQAVLATWWMASDTCISTIPR